MRPTRLFGLLALVVTGGAALAQEKVENPEYSAWAKYKVGTSVTERTIVAGTSEETLTTTTLVKVTPEKVVVKVTAVTTEGGKRRAAAPREEEYPKTVALPKGVSKAAFAAGKPKGTKKEGTETLKLFGQELTTKWYEYEEKDKEKTSLREFKSKVWVSDEVPMRAVKMHVKVKTTNKGEPPFTTDSRTEVVEFKKP